MICSSLLPSIIHPSSAHILQKCVPVRVGCQSWWAMGYCLLLMFLTQFHPTASLHLAKLLQIMPSYCLALFMVGADIAVILVRTCIVLNTIHTCQPLPNLYSTSDGKYDLSDCFQCMSVCLALLVCGTILWLLTGKVWQILHKQYGLQHFVHAVVDHPILADLVAVPNQTFFLKCHMQLKHVICHQLYQSNLSWQSSISHVPYSFM